MQDLKRVTSNYCSAWSRTLNHFSQSKTDFSMALFVGFRRLLCWEAISYFEYSWYKEMMARSALTSNFMLWKRFMRPILFSASFCSALFLLECNLTPCHPGKRNFWLAYRYCAFEEKEVWIVGPWRVCTKFAFKIVSSKCRLFPQPTTVPRHKSPRRWNWPQFVLMFAIEICYLSNTRHVCRPTHDSILAFFKHQQSLIDLFSSSMAENPSFKRSSRSMTFSFRQIRKSHLWASLVFDQLFFN